jgi:hypothetical protein
MHYTVNGGDNWQVQWPRHRPSTWAPWYRAVRFANAAHGWAVGDSGIILKGAFQARSTHVSVPHALSDNQIRLHASYLPGRLLRLDYALPGPGKVRISLFDVRGRKLCALAQTGKVAGKHQGIFPMPGIQHAGLYIVRLDFNGQTKTAKAMFVF